MQPLEERGIAGTSAFGQEDRGGKIGQIFANPTALADDDVPASLPGRENEQQLAIELPHQRLDGQNERLDGVPLRI